MISVKTKIRFSLFLLCTFFFITQISTVFAAENTENAEALRSALVDYAKKYVGSPYKYGAIGPDSFDCSGFIFTISRESTGYQLPRTVKALYSFVKVIPQNQLEMGDIVFFRTTSDGSISHAGIYMGNNQFMHAVSDGPNTGVIVSSLKENTWKNAYAGAGKFLPSSVSESTKSTETIAVASLASNSASAKTTSTTTKASSSQVVKTASTKSSSSKKSSSSDFVNNLIFDASAGIDWSLFSANRFMLNFRGVPLMANIRYSDWPLQPGFGLGVRFNTASDVLQIPILFSITVNDYFRAYAGPVITVGGPELPGDSDTDIDASVFPGIIGFSWNTPSFTDGIVKISLVQDISYTVFNKTDGGALSAKNSLAAGIAFSTGLRVTLPFNKLFK